MPSSRRPYVPPELHVLEREVMEALWRLGESKVADVLLALNEAGPKQRAYTTVMTICARLERKGLLSRRRQSKGYVYSPTMSRDEYRQARAQAQVGSLVDEYGEVALVHFARQMDTLDPKRREQLRRLAKRRD